MYFVRLKPLKQQLAAGDLPQPEAFRYILVTAVAWTFFMNSELGAVNRPAEWLWFITLLNCLLTGLGMWGVYRANGGSGGRDFIARVTALGWVVGIRTALVLMVPLIVLGWLADPAFDGTGPAPMFGDLISTLLTFGIFYWRLAVHMRELSKSGAEFSSMPAQVAAVP